MSTVLDPHDPLSAALRDEIGAEIARFIDDRRDLLTDVGPEALVLGDLAQAFAAGGKRMRPAFAVWGAVAAAGVPDDPALWIRAAASLDLLHTGILIHDDVMDSSDTRRGLPAAHHQLAARHAEHHLLGEPQGFGRAGAILLGDLMQLWSIEMLDTSGLSAIDLDRARPALARMRTEVTCGQFLDVHVQHEPIHDGQHALLAAARVVEYKTAKYTVQRPVQFGALLGGGSDELLAGLEAYGSALGRAFQFRDDLLGVFGDEVTTGKPAGDDLREGKRTVLVAHAFTGTTDAGRALLTSLLGDPTMDADQIAELRGLIVDSGAPELVESMIAEGFEGALAALRAPMTEEGRTALTQLALAATQRTF
ncbi:MAG: polyprenyl synthetase family protein [Propionibacteriaceae bacterium]|nr:polyprenyl synthetase family protein [Propionibacteriaceae bacterium]